MGCMGRVSRNKGLAEYEAVAEREAVVEYCALCGREIGEAVERHHLVPKSRGGKEAVSLHPICHRTIHANLSNKELATRFDNIEALRVHEEIARFLKWVANKDPDFDAPTRKQR